MTEDYVKKAKNCYNVGNNEGAKICALIAIAEHLQDIDTSLFDLSENGVTVYTEEAQK